MTIPTCPKCGSAMVERSSKKNGRKFYGCSTWARTKCSGFVPFFVEKTAIEHKEYRVQDIVGSPEQNAIWALVNSKEHVVIEAVAGSGKTFTAVHFLQLFPRDKSVLFLAFNKHIAEELQARLPAGFDASTLHSFGYKIIKRAYPRMRVNKHKLPDILLALLPKDSDKEIEPINQFLRASAEKLVRMAKYNMSDLDDESLDYIADRYDVQLNDSRNQIFDLARHAYRASVEDIKTIDFDDMIFFVLAYNLPIAEIDLIIGDEIQDWNAMQQQLVMRAVANNRFIGVGDRYQSIYGFAGADINSIPNMIELLGKTTRNVIIKPLNETRRCPKSHVALASEIVPHIRAMDSAIDGEIYNIKTRDIVKHVKVGDLVISRRNAPLISIAYALLRNGIRAIVRGRDFATGLINLVLKFKAVSITELIEVAETYRTKELDKLNARGNKAENQIDALNDKIDTLIALTEGLDTVDQLITKLNTLFSDQNDASAVILSSVHRAKGLEADNVFIADYDKIEIPMDQEWNQQQEKNLHYVALTRSKSALYLCQSDTKKKKK